MSNISTAMLLTAAKRFELNIIDSVVHGLGCDYQDKVGLLLAQESNFDQMPFLPPQ